MAAAGPAAIAMQAAGSLMQGIEANKAARGQARVDEENARLSILDGEQQALQTSHDERMQAGLQLTDLADAGVQLGTGSAADVLAESAYQRELEILNIRTRATRQANNLYQDAADKRAAGRSALIGGMFGAAASALKGVADTRAQRTTAASIGRVNSAVAGGSPPVPRPMIMGVSR